MPKQDIPSTILGAIWSLGFIACVVGSLVYSACDHMRESERWEQFRDEHACKLTRSYAHRGLVDPAETCWVCDDGVEYCK